VEEGVGVVRAAEGEAIKGELEGTAEAVGVAAKGRDFVGTIPVLLGSLDCREVGVSLLAVAVEASEAEGTCGVSEGGALALPERKGEGEGREGEDVGFRAVTVA
jgi:hypothetical protein